MASYKCDYCDVIASFALSKHGVDCHYRKQHESRALKRAAGKAKLDAKRRDDRLIECINNPSAIYIHRAEDWLSTVNAKGLTSRYPHSQFLIKYAIAEYLASADNTSVFS